MPIESMLVTVGSVAPDFTLPSAGGGEVRLSRYLGKQCVVLVFLRAFM